MVALASLGLAFVALLAYRHPETAWHTGKYVLFAGSVIASVTGLGLWWFQTNMIYPANYPPGSRKIVADPYTVAGIPYTPIKLTTPDNIVIHAYEIYARPKTSRQNLPGVSPASFQKPALDESSLASLAEKWQLDADGEAFVKSRPTVIMYHANAGNMGHRIPLAKAFWHALEYNVVMLSYRGYGLSQGSPSEKGMRIDAQTMLDHVKAHPILKHTPIIVYGQSIGGCVSIDVASRNSDKIHALIIENSPLSLRSLIPFVMPMITPFLSIPNILTEQWDAHVSIPLIDKKLPVLLLAGGKDELVVPTQMKGIRKLREEAGGLVEWKEFENGTHNDTCMQPGYWDTINQFVKSHVMS